MLTRARFSDKQWDAQVTKCNKPRCGTCVYIRQGNNITFNNTNSVFNVKFNMSCESKYVIYALTCANCNLMYIGQTSDLRSRLTVHRQQINNENHCFLPVSRHIRQCASHLYPPFTVFPFYKVQDGNQALMDVKEILFIKKYKPMLNGSHRP